MGKPNVPGLTHVHHFSIIYAKLAITGSKVHGSEFKVKNDEGGATSFRQIPCSSRFFTQSPWNTICRSGNMKKIPVKP
jgi:hypothetical protein